MKGFLTSSLLSLFVTFIAVGLPCTGIASPSTQKLSTRAPSLTKVAPQNVCMVTDRLFDKEQIRITVAKKDYFGCCDMCKDRLAQDATIRQAVDPVSGKSVDKASAVIGARSDGSVLYFETEANLKAYRE